jgi:hypothetical protein
MIDIEVTETSLVDHPAHLHEGWLVMKSATEESIDSLFGTLTKKEVTPMADTEKTLSTEEYDSLVAKAARADELEAANAELTKAAEAAAAAPAPAATEEDILKSVPESVRIRLEKAEADNAATREALQKERDARLDDAAVTASKGLFKSLAFDHATVAPALRRLEVINPDVAKSVMEVLKAAEGQLESAGIFQELGKSTDNTPKTATEKFADLAKSIRETDPTLTAEQAFAKAVNSRPDLYTDYTEGK